MLRRNFASASGVIVDVCPVDGVWFDKGELAMIIEFATTGALRKAEQDTKERSAARKRLDAWEEGLGAAGPLHLHGGGIARIIPHVDPEKK
jgi:Zn-finger nucleic acid-binding protein